jgi:geranylgeranyl transferase type-1 subunit beta
MPDPEFESRLDKAKHIIYWKRCLKTYLPPHYTTMDANRMMLVYLTFLSLDLLDALDTTLTESERQNCLDWVYLCQHHDGGFRGSPGVNLDGRENLDNAAWDVASIPSTMFALSILAVLKDDFARVRRKETLQWLTRLQRPDGSFGEHLGEGGVVEGGMDTRFGFCAVGIRWMLRGRAMGEVEGVQDVRIDQFINCISLAQTYDGGISEMPCHEPHGGYTYCALAALALIDGLPSEIHNHQSGELSARRPPGLSSIDATTHWLLSRQTAELELPGEEQDSSSDDEADEQDDDTIRWAGFNGRCNKIADTCYAWWIGGSLAILNRLHLINAPLSRDYLYDKTQHLIGGFGKKAGDPPDIYHSALGLAALALMDEPGLKGISPVLCLSREACAWVERLEWRREIWDVPENSTEFSTK